MSDIPRPTVVPITAKPKKIDAELSRTLREIADAVDRGEVVEMVASYIHENEYKFVYGASLADCLVLVSLLQHRCVQRFKA